MADTTCTILAIETSCDETSAAVVVDGWDVRSSLVSSQVKLHEKYGGVVPEIAARAHIERIGPIVEEALASAGVSYGDLDAIAVTDGPGLVGSLLIGVTAAKTLAPALDRPLVPVDHIEAHATSAALEGSGFRVQGSGTNGEAAGQPPRATAVSAVADADGGPGAQRSQRSGTLPKSRIQNPKSKITPWPAVALVVSGGHTSIYHVRDFLDIQLLGQTVDDAAGEAFDKVAAMLELGFPGGPAIDRLARNGDPRAIRFPRTWLNEPHLNFSFSGLKTSVLYHVFGQGKKYGSVAHLSQQQIADIAASFQAALVEPLVTKTVAAAQQVGVRNVVVGGGVAANSALRAGLQAACDSAALRLHLTPMHYCTDNAAMIGALAYHRLQAGLTADLDLEPRAGLRRPAKR